MVPHRYIPTEFIIAKVVRDFNPITMAWTTNAYQWIGEALDQIGGIRLTPRFSAEVEPDTNNKIIIPCRAEALIGLEVDGCWVRWKNFKELSCNECNVTTIEFYGGQQITESYAVINYNYIELVNVSGTEYILHYYAFPEDCNGNALIVDDPVLHEALAWYVMTKLCLNGVPHPVIDYRTAMSAWGTNKDNAQNRLLMPTPLEFPNTMVDFQRYKI